MVAGRSEHDLGRPARATEILVYEVFRDGEGLDLGGSSAQSFVLMLLMSAPTVLQFSSAACV
jgi:sn-glycerol 3-phosphate transport system permease protein